MIDEVNADDFAGVGDLDVRAGHRPDQARNVIPARYHERMAMTLRLTEDETAVIRAAAAEEGKSMQEYIRTAALTFATERSRRREAAIQGVLTDYAELFERLKDA